MTDVSNGATPFDKALDLELEQLQGASAPIRRAPLPPIRKSEKFFAAIGLGLTPWTKNVAVRALVYENERLPYPPQAGTLTLMEERTRRSAIDAAEKGLEKVARGPIEGTIDVIKKLYARINQIDGECDLRAARAIIGPNHERFTRAEADAKHDELRDELDAARRDGGTGHYRDRQRNPRKDALIVLLDFPIFLFLTISLLNADVRLALSGDASAITKLIMAVMFAVLGTMAFTWTTRHTGRRHRRFKTPDSTVDRANPVFKRVLAERIGLGALIGIAGVVMLLRIVHDGLVAHSALYVMIPLAVFFALVIAATGYIGYMSEFEDGSEKTEQLDHMTGQLTQRDGQQEAAQADRTELTEQAGIQIAVLTRTITDAHAHAVRSVTGSKEDKAIMIARSYAGRQDRLPAPEFDVPSFDLAVEQAGQLAEHHALLTQRTTSTAARWTQIAPTTAFTARS